MNTRVLAALGLPEDADTVTVLSAIADLKATAERRKGLRPEHLADLAAMAGTSMEYDRLTREIEAEERRREDEDRRERLLAVAVAEGRIKESDTDALRALYSINPETVKDVLLSFPAPPATRDVAETINAAGEVVDAHSDPDWLHARATHLLAEKGIRDPTEEDYAEALEEARR